MNGEMNELGVVTTVDDKGDYKNEVHDVARFLKGVRSKTGLSATEVASKYDIPLQTYLQWESGRRTPPEYVVKMLSESLLNSYYEKVARNKMGIHLGSMIDLDLIKVGCPVSIVEGVHVISNVDELGDRHFYLTIGKVREEDVNLLQFWLKAPFDADYYEDVCTKMDACNTESDKHSIGRISQLKRAEDWKAEYKRYLCDLDALHSHNAKV